jgi:hypothetical protein
MLRTLSLAFVVVVSLAASAVPAQAGYTMQDVGQMLRSRGYEPEFHRDGYYVIRHGGYPYRVFPSGDGSRIFIRVNLAILEPRHFDAPQFRQVLRLHETVGFAGQFDHRDNQLFFNLRIDVNNFQPSHLDDHLRHISRTLDTHREQWNPRHWDRR